MQSKITPTAPVATSCPARLSEALTFLGIAPERHTAVEQQLRERGLLDGGVVDLTQPGVRRILEPLMTRRRTAATSSTRKAPAARRTARPPAPWHEAIDQALTLLGVPAERQAGCRVALYGRGLVVDGCVDLASPAVAEALGLPPARARQALAASRAADREAEQRIFERRQRQRFGVL